MLLPPLTSLVCCTTNVATFPSLIVMASSLKPMLKAIKRVYQSHCLIAKTFKNERENEFHRKNLTDWPELVIGHS